MEIAMGGYAMIAQLAKHKQQSHRITSAAQCHDNSVAMMQQLLLFDKPTYLLKVLSHRIFIKKRRKTVVYRRYILRYLADSNCRTRFCRPLPSHSVKVPYILICGCKGNAIFLISNYYYKLFFNFSLFSQHLRCSALFFKSLSWQSAVQESQPRVRLKNFL